MSGRIVLALAIGAAVALPGAASASHGSSDGPPRDFAVGSAANTFPGGGPSRIAFAAHSDPSGLGSDGYFRAAGDLDGAGPLEPFSFQGEVTCVRVSGNRAAIKYRIERATGSGEPLEGGGVQVFVEDNGAPGRGAPDATTFDPPQPAGAFDLAGPGQCDDPDSRAGYDPVDSGNVVVHDALP